jgi:hypothetical protein
VNIEIFAYTMQSNGGTYDMPLTEELLVSLNQLAQTDVTERQGVSSGDRAINEFIQALKRTMQASRSRDLDPQNKQVIPLFCINEVQACSAHHECP